MKKDAKDALKVQLDELKRTGGSVPSTILVGFIQALGPVGVPLAILKKYSDIKRWDSERELLVSLLYDIRKESKDVYDEFRSDFDDVLSLIQDVLDEHSEKIQSQELINEIIGQRVLSVESGIRGIGGTIRREGNATIISAPNPVNDSFAAIQRGDYQNAAYHAKRAIESDPKDNNGYTNMGVALAKLGCLEESLWFFKKAMTLNPRDDNAHLNYNAVKEKLKDKKESHSGSNSA